jgi:hypothetical protein
VRLIKSSGLLNPSLGDTSAFGDLSSTQTYRGNKAQRTEETDAWVRPTTSSGTLDSQGVFELVVAMRSKA